MRIRLTARIRFATHTVAILALTGFLVILFGCSWLPWQGDLYGGSGQVFLLDVGWDFSRDIEYRLNIGGTPADVYFAFVSYGNAPTNSPAVSMRNSDGPPIGDLMVSRSASTAPSASVTSGRRVATAPISEFNNNPPEMIPGPAARSPLPRAGESYGDSGVFWQFNGSFSTQDAVEIDATVRKSVMSDGVTVNVWVDDILHESNLSYDPDGPGGTPAGPGPITDTMVVELANEFLVEGAEEGIYDWVTNVIGAPWGPHGYANLLDPAEVEDTIDILLIDVLQDQADTEGIVGFFWAKDNYYRTGNGSFTDYSNQRVMFYIDAILYSQSDGGPWDSSHYWPQVAISTLAHEFQHMIHYYQKSVLQLFGMGTETWLNEMASMVTEDLISDQMEVEGPRGVDPLVHPDGSAGTTANENGRLPRYNAFNDISLYAWDYTDPLPNYSINYAFGSYLVRNFGGAQFLRDLIQSPYTDYQAVEYAAESSGWDLSFRQILSRWAGAVLLSDVVANETSEPALKGMRYNSGEWFPSSVNGALYSLGSINLYNYFFAETTQTGPAVFTSGVPYVGQGEWLPGTSVTYFLAGAGLTGEPEWDIRLGSRTDLVVVAKPSP